jgi:hypothetical protein
MITLSSKKKEEKKLKKKHENKKKWKVIKNKIALFVDS